MNRNPLYLRDLPQRGRKSSRIHWISFPPAGGNAKGVYFNKKNKMKIRLILIALCFIIITGSSCHRNRLKTNEKDLKEDILRQEKEETDKIAGAKDPADPVNRLPKGFRYKENRSADPANMPVKIDIAGNLTNIREFKLSDIASEIRYVRLDPVPDSTIPSDLKFKYHLTDNYVVAANLYGIHLYSKEGRYIRSVVKNEMTGVIVRQNMIMFYTDYTMKGGGMSIKSNGDILYYDYVNNMTGEKYIMKLDCNSAHLAKEYRYDPEFPDRISGLGEIALDLNHGKTEPPKPRSHQGMFGGPGEWLNNEFGVYMLTDDLYALPSWEENILVIRNIYGDTLTSFTRFEKIVNYTKSLMRGTDDGVHYENLGSLYLRPEYNDTVFRVTPPDRLYPVYVLSLGEYKVTRQQGVDPDFNLTGKIIPEEWAETGNFIFLTFTKDDYDCPNTRKNKTVKIYHAIYSKLTRQLAVIKGDPYDYSTEILRNDIDGGPPVWPSSYMIGNNGEIMIPLKGKDLKERIKSEYFKASDAPVGKKSELENLAVSVSDSGDILMIVK
jgi:hypothetical protein